MAWLRGNRKTGWRVEWRIGGRDSDIDTGPYIHDHGDAMLALREHREKESFRKAVNGHALSSTALDVLLAKWKAHQVKEGKVSTAYADDVTRTILRIAKPEGWKAVRDMTKPAVRKWCDRTARGTVGPLRMIKSVLNWARIIEDLPTDLGVQDVGKRLRRERKPAPDLLTDDQVHRAWALAFVEGGFSVGLAVEHLALFPCRPIDVCRCLISDWDSASQIITYRKTKNGKSVRHWVPDLHAKRLDALTVDRKPAEYLFLTKHRCPWVIKGGRADQMTLWYWHNVGEVLFQGRQRGMYCLKRYAMTRLKKAAGGDSKSVMAVSGHLTEEMVDLYAATNIPVQKELLGKVPNPFVISQTTDIPKIEIQSAHQSAPMHPHTSPDIVSES